ncbi:MAG: hypothetical protein IK081_02155 [Lachnospiraceae bacterium]|nr:hypothetical protein [Lachnospiraceae bacterium]
MRKSSKKAFVRTLGFLVIMILTVFAFSAQAKADKFKCSICDEWKEDGVDYCIWCMGCEDCVEICDRCGETCLGCHRDHPGVEEYAPCPDCGKCKEGVDYCLNCGRCAECVTMCDRCGERCLLCHEEYPGTEEYEACPDCGRCKEGVYYCHECGRCEDCTELCNICHETCMECGELIMGDPTDEKAPCPGCEECKADGREFCRECGYCENCVALCEGCGFCNECAMVIGLHCPECENCYEDVYRCADGGDHCKECCELCPECGKCFIEAGEDACVYCERCEECCAENQCRLCGICEMDPAYEEHFCVDCGRCFGEADQCDGCMLADEIRCVECCEALARLEGCNCTSPVCVCDPSYYEHMASIHGITFAGHSATASNAWSLDDTYHWHDCRICVESSHITDKAKHSYNEFGVCTVCGYSANAEIVITSQPKDCHAKIHYIGWGPSYLEAVPDEENTVKFAVTAYGKNAKKDLHYQWYCKRAGSSAKIVQEGTGIYSEGFCRGAQLPVLTINVITDACYLTDYGEPYEFYCVITDDNGNSVTSESGKMLVKHDHLLWFSDNLKNEQGHVLCCVGDGCPSVSKLQPHEYGDYKWVLKADGTQDYAYRECTVCGYRETFEAHEHQYDYVAMLDAIYRDEVTRVKEDTVRNIYIYEYEQDGHTIRGEFTPLYHSITCSVAGCHFAMQEKHDWSSWSVVNPCSAKAPGAIYRTCSVCEMQETWNKQGYWWHTHPINIKNGHVKEMDGALLQDEAVLSRIINQIILKANKLEEYDIAEEGSTVLILPDPVEGKKVKSVNVTIDLSIKGYNDVYTQTLDVTELKAGLAYAFTVPVSDDRNDYQGNYVEIEFVYETCTHAERKTINRVNATCTEIGYSGDSVCRFCEHLIRKGEFIAPTGHDEAVPATEDVYASNAKGEIARDRDGYKLYTIHMAETVSCDDSDYRGSYTGDLICPKCKEVLVKGKYVEKEHSYQLLNLFDEKTRKNLQQRYGVREYEPPHNGQDGYSGDFVCEICGKIKWGHVIKSQQFAPEVKISKKSLTLYDTIAIDFKIEEAALEGKYENPYLIVTHNGVESQLTTCKDSSDDKYYVFSVRVAPHELGDVLTVLPCAYNEYGEEVKGTSIDYSVAEYCKNMLNNEKYQDAAWATFRRLLVDILLYGDAAQVYAEYKTDSLVSAFLTDAQRSMGTNVNVAMNYQSVKDKAFATVDEEDQLASLEAAALYLEAAVNIQFKYTADNLSGLCVVVTDDENGTNVMEKLTVKANLIDDKGRYYVTFGGLNAGQMRKTVYATMMKGNKKVSNTYRYSIESYAASMKGKGVPNLDNLLDAMMRYGDSAAAYASGN